MASLPEFMVLQVRGCGWVKHGDANAVVVENGDGVFDPLSKIEIERSKSNANVYVHLRFCQSNKYWARSDDGWVVANATKPEEDASKSSCTLFRYVPEGGFRHVQSDRYVKNDSNNRMYVADPEVDTGFTSLTIVDWGTFTKLPKHVAFKGDNGKYLEAYGRKYLNFSSDDANVDKSGHQIFLLPDGCVFIKSDFFDKFWRLSSNNRICGDTDVAGAGTIFRPVKISGPIIALKSERNLKFCGRFNPDYLSASVPTIMKKEAQFEVEELVKSRRVYNVKYRMEDARVYGEKPFDAGITAAFNDNIQEASNSIDISYQESSSYTFSQSVSVTGGVKITLDNVGIPFIAQNGIVISSPVTAAYQWSDKKTTTKWVKANGAVSIPARSSARVKYVGTTGSCDIPFSYTQEDQSSTDGTITHTEMTDGVFTGVNSYNFSFEIDEVTPL